MKYVVASVVAVLVIGAAFFIPYHWEVLVPVPEAEKVETVHIIFGGDMMFDRYIRSVIQTVGGDYVFSCIDQLLIPADLVVANLEGPITANESVTTSPDVPGYNHYKFTFPLATAALLKRHNVGVVNLGNNHVLDFGHEGVLETVTSLELAGVGHFGSPGATSSVSYMKLHDVPLAFINYNEFFHADSRMIYHTIQDARKSGRVPIVYAHWGDEYAPTPERVKMLARGFVDAGAELVTGSHSHIEGEHEIYNGKHIYYSLGNFIFDQYFEDSVRNGILLDVELSSDGVLGVTRVPIVLNSDGRTCPR